MKILIVTPIFPPEIGGPATYTWELAHRLTEDEIGIIAFGDTLKPIDCAKLYQLNVRKGLFRKIPVIGSIIRQFGLLMSLLKYGREYDLIYLQGPLITGFIGGLAAKLIRKPVIIKFVGDIAWETAYTKGRTDNNLNDFLESGGGGVPRMLQKSALGSTFGIIVPSKYLKSVLVKHYCIPEDKIYVIYNAVDVPFINKTSPKDDIKTILTIGRLVPHKNIAGIIEALSMLDDKYSLRIIGEGPEGTNLRRLAHAKGIHLRVTFLGPLSHEETLREIAMSDLLVLNSIYEGLPHTLVEAMYLRTPVLATDILGTTEVANIRTAVLTKPNNPHDLARNIKASFSINNTEEAYKFVALNFNWEQNLKQLQAVFSSIKK